MKAQNTYNEKTYSVLSIRVPKEQLTKFKTKCKENGDSQMSLINGFICGYTDDKPIIRNRTIKECFDFGIEEVILEQLIGDRTQTVLHREDFEKGGKMEKFINYTIGRIEHEFASVVYLT